MSENIDMEFVELKMNKNKTISYVCMLCNYETTRKSNLVKHFESKKHKRKLEENAVRQTAKIIKHSVKKEPQTKYKFSCSCGKRLNINLVFRVIRDVVKRMQNLIVMKKNMMKKNL